MTNHILKAHLSQLVLRLKGARNNSQFLKAKPPDRTDMEEGSQVKHLDRKQRGNEKHSTDVRMMMMMMMMLKEQTEADLDVVMVALWM